MEYVIIRHLGSVFVAVQAVWYGGGSLCCEILMLSIDHMCNDNDVQLSSDSDVELNSGSGQW